MFGRDSWRSFCLALLLMQGHLEQAAPLSRHRLNISKDRHSTASLGRLCHCSLTLTAQKFLIFRGSLQCFSSCPLPLVLSLDTSGKSLPCILPSDISNVDKAPLLSLVFSRLKSPALSALPHKRDTPVSNTS